MPTHGFITHPVKDYLSDRKNNGHDLDPFDWLKKVKNLESLVVDGIEVVAEDIYSFAKLVARAARDLLKLERALDKNKTSDMDSRVIDAIKNFDPGGLQTNSVRFILDQPLQIKSIGIIQRERQANIENQDLKNDVEQNTVYSSPIGISFFIKNKANKKGDDSDDTFSSSL